MDAMTRLEIEWPTITRSTNARRALTRWTEKYPELDQIANLDGFIKRYADKRPLVRILAELAVDDDLAARTLLQTMIPGLHRLSWNLGIAESANLDELVSIAWIKIVEYPLHRPGAVAANLIADIRKQYVRDHRRAVVPFPVESSPSPEEAVLSTLAIDRAVALADAGIIEPAVLRTIVRTRFLGDRLCDVAAEEHLTVSTLTQRRLKTERKLRQLAPCAA